MRVVKGSPKKSFSDCIGKFRTYAKGRIIKNIRQLEVVIAFGKCTVKISVAHHKVV
jgi:hypothetical protein